LIPKNKDSLLQGTSFFDYKRKNTDPLPALFYALISKPSLLKLKQTLSLFINAGSRRVLFAKKSATF
jgi:hypothetical protein